MGLHGIAREALHEKGTFEHRLEGVREQVRQNLDSVLQAEGAVSTKSLRPGARGESSR